MKYHQRTLDLIGQPDLPLDPAREAAAVQNAAAVGVALPAAVAEWYSVPEDSALWKWWHFGQCDAPAIWKESAAKSEIIGRPEIEGYHNWVNPPICHDLRDWIRPPILPIMSENLGFSWWGVTLDGTADPPVVISYELGDTWEACAGSFSSCVFARIFDGLTTYSTSGAKRTLVMKKWVTGDDRRALRACFDLEPTTRGLFCLPNAVVERYSRCGQRFSFYNQFSGDHYDQCSHWQLWAADEVNMASLVGRLSGIFPMLGNLMMVPERSDPEIPF